MQLTRRSRVRAVVSTGLQDMEGISNHGGTGRARGGIVPATDLGIPRRQTLVLSPFRESSVDVVLPDLGHGQPPETAVARGSTTGLYDRHQLLLEEVGGVTVVVSPEHLLNVNSEEDLERVHMLLSTTER